MYKCLVIYMGMPYIHVCICLRIFLNLKGHALSPKICTCRFFADDKEAPSENRCGFCNSLRPFCHSCFSDSILGGLVFCFDLKRCVWEVKLGILRSHSVLQILVQQRIWQKKKKSRTCSAKQGVFFAGFADCPQICKVRSATNLSRRCVLKKSTFHLQLKSAKLQQEKCKTQRVLKTSKRAPNIQPNLLYVISKTPLKRIVL